MSVTLETAIGTQQGRVIVASGEFPARIEDSKSGRVPFALAIFVSAFLLFQVQLLLGKEALPLFGGASAVWTVCVFVFQLLFLAGYGYSHGLATWLPLRKQVILHGSLLGVCAVFIAVQAYIRSAPIGSAPNWQPRPGADPAWAITRVASAAPQIKTTRASNRFFMLSPTHSHKRPFDGLQSSSAGRKIDADSKVSSLEG